MWDENIDVFCMQFTANAISSFVKVDYSLVIVELHPSYGKEIDLVYMMQAMKNTPILAITNPLSSDEKVLLFRAGIGAYIEKPLDLSVCKAQANALIQLYAESNQKSVQSSPVVFGTKLMVNPQCRQVFVNGELLRLTRKEFDLLYYLASHPNQIFSKEQLFDCVWQYNSDIDGSATVKTHTETVRAYNPLRPGNGSPTFRSAPCPQPPRPPRKSGADRVAHCGEYAG